MTAGPVPATADADPLTAALDYASRGYRVVPIAPGTKYPQGLTAWQNAATTDPDTITSWWTGLYKGHGVGIATGPGSGLWVLDVDDYEVYRDLERTHEELPETLTSLTGSGGMHFLFAYPTDGSTITNANRLPAGIDVRGEGGFIVAPPTTHPNGKAYEWDLGQGTEPVDAPEWLLELVVQREVVPEPRPLRDVQGDRPGDLWAAETSWADLLERDGWQLHHVDRRDGTEHWTRPGKERREGTSATVGGPNGRDTLKVFTSSMVGDGLEEGATYTKLGYLAARHHHGDHAAAARALAANGWRTERNDIEELIVGDAEGDEELTGHGWEPWDLTDVLSGTWEPPTPTMLVRLDGVGLIYPGRVHSIAGEPGGGKTWLALHLAAEVIQGGGRALVIDYEDTPSSCVARLRALGLSDPQIADGLIYVQPQRPLVGRGRMNVDALEELARWDVGIAVIDSVGESIATEGLKPNDDDDVVRWMQALPRRLAHRNGAAVLLLDHVAKEKEGRGLWAIGSQRKLAAIDGAAYMLEVGVAPTRTIEGHVKLICAKDRHGTHQRGHQVALIDIVPRGEQTTITVRAPQAPGEPFRPTALMERVSRFLEEEGTSSKNAVLTNVKGKSKEVLGQALDQLVAEDYVEAKPPPGRGKGYEYRSLKAFRDDVEELVEPVDNSLRNDENGGYPQPRPTSPEPRPARSGGGPGGTSPDLTPDTPVGGAGRGEVPPTHQRQVSTTDLAGEVDPLKELFR